MRVAIMLNSQITNYHYFLTNIVKILMKPDCIYALSTNKKDRKSAPNKTN